MRRVELVFIDRSIDPAALILFADNPLFDKSKRYLSTPVLCCVGGWMCLFGIIDSIRWWSKEYFSSRTNNKGAQKINEEINIDTANCDDDDEWRWLLWWRWWWGGDDSKSDWRPMARNGEPLLASLGDRRDDHELKRAHLSLSCLLWLLWSLPIVMMLIKVGWWS